MALIPGFQTLQIDPLTLGTITIATDHHQVHEGDTFSAWLFDVGVIASAAVLEMAFETPAAGSPQKRMHVIIMANASAQAVLRLWQITGNIGGGTAFGEPPNRRDDQPDDSDLQLIDGADKILLNSPALATPITGIATPVLRAAEQFDSRTSGAPAASRGALEFVLNPDQKYHLTLTSGAANNVAFLGMVWYEHTDGQA